MQKLYPEKFKCCVISLCTLGFAICGPKNYKQRQDKQSQQVTSTTRDTLVEINKVLTTLQLPYRKAFISNDNECDRLHARISYQTMEDLWKVFADKKQTEYTLTAQN
jgi:hypothetical protein